MPPRAAPELVVVVVVVVCVSWLARPVLGSCQSLGCYMTPESQATGECACDFECESRGDCCVDFEQVCNVQCWVIPPTPTDRRTNTSRVSISTLVSNHLSSVPSPDTPWETEADVQSHIAHVAFIVGREDSDVVVLQQVHSCRALRQLIKLLPAGNDYQPYFILPEGLNHSVGLLTRMDPASALYSAVQGHTYPVAAAECAELHLGLPSCDHHLVATMNLRGLSKPLTLLATSLPSSFTTPAVRPTSEAQATTLATLASLFLSQRHHVVVAGGFNDEDRAFGERAEPANVVEEVLGAGLTNAAEELSNADRSSVWEDVNGDCAEQPSTEQFLTDHILYSPSLDLATVTTGSSLYPHVCHTYFPSHWPVTATLHKVEKEVTFAWGFVVIGIGLVAGAIGLAYARKRHLQGVAMRAVTNARGEGTELREVSSVSPPGRLESNTRNNWALPFRWPTGVMAVAHEQHLLIWEIEGSLARNVARLPAHSPMTCATAVFREPATGLTLVSGGEDWNFKQFKRGAQGSWEVASHVSNAHGGAILSIAQAGDQLVTSGEDGVVKLWTRFRTTRLLKGHVGSVYTVLAMEGGKFVVSGGQDETIRVWEVATGKCVQVMRTQNEGVTCMALFEPPTRASAVAAGAGAGGAAAGAAAPAAHAPDVPQHVRDALNQLRAEQQQQQPASDGAAPHQDPPSSSPSSPQLAPQDAAHASPDQRSVLVAGGRDGTVGVWVRRGDAWEELHTLRGHTEPVRAVAIVDTQAVAVDKDNGPKAASVGAALAKHAKGPRLRVVSAARDACVRVWDPFLPECLHTMLGHSISRLVAMEGRVMGGGEEGRLKVWDCEQGACVASLALSGKGRINGIAVGWRSAKGKGRGRVELVAPPLARSLSAPHHSDVVLSRGHAGAELVSPIALAEPREPLLPNEQRRDGDEGGGGAVADGPEVARADVAHLDEEMQPLRLADGGS